MDHPELEQQCETENQKAKGPMMQGSVELDSWLLGCKSLLADPTSFLSAHFSHNAPWVGMASTVEQRNGGKNRQTRSV